MQVLEGTGCDKGLVPMFVVRVMVMGAAAAAATAPVAVSAAFPALAETSVQRVGQGQEKEGGNDICSHVDSVVLVEDRGMVYLEGKAGFLTSR